MGKSLQDLYGDILIGKPYQKPLLKKPLINKFKSLSECYSQVNKPIIESVFPKWFDLSKDKNIKGKPILSPYYTKLIINELSSLYDDLEKKALPRIERLQPIDDKEFIDRVKQIRLPDIKNIEFIETYEPGDRNNTSDKFNMYKFIITRVDDRQVPIGIITTGKVTGDAWSTQAKESIPGIIWFMIGAGIPVPEIFKTGQNLNTKEAKNIARRYVQSFEQFFNKGKWRKSVKLTQEDIAEIEKILNLLNIIGGKNLNDLKANHFTKFKEAASIATLLYESGYNINEHIYMHAEKYQSIRSNSAAQIKMPPDKWNPSDIYIILAEYYETILQKLNTIINSDPAANIEKINEINSLFSGIWGSDGLSDDTPLIGISLKESKAQGGKAKSYLSTLVDNASKIYNVRQDEIYDEPNLYIDVINKIRQDNLKLIKKLNNSTYNMNLNYMIDNKPIKNDLDFLMKKYGCEKIFKFILDQALKHEDIFVELAIYAHALGETSPPFFKVIGSPQKGIADAKLQQFNVVERWTNNDGIEYVEIFDSNTATDIVIRVPLYFESNDVPEGYGGIIPIVIRSGGKSIMVDSRPLEKKTK